MGRSSPFLRAHCLRLQTRFQAAATQVKALAAKPSDDELLKVYALFKQGTVGDCNAPAPGMFDFTGKAKHAAWSALKGKSQDDAKAEYIAFVAALASK